MRHLRVASTTIRLGAVGAVLAVLAVLTPAAAFAGSDDAAPGDSVTTTQTMRPAGSSTGPSTGTVVDEGTSPTDSESGPEPVPDTDPEDSAEDSAEDDEATTDEAATDEAITPETEPVAPPAGAGAQQPEPSVAQAATEPAGEPSVELEQYEQVGGQWQSSDGSVDFGNEIRYAFRVVVPAGQTLPATQLRSYVPGWDQANDQVTTVPARLVAGSARCSIACDVEANQNNGLVTWRLGTLVAGDEDVEVTAEFTVRFGDLPLDAQFDSSGMFFARAWCRGELSWSEQPARLAGEPVTGQASTGPVFSNAVTATAMALEAIIGTPVAYPAAPGISATAGPAHGHHSASGVTATVLPNTGGPQSALAVAGVALVLLGGLIVVRARRSGRDAR